MELPCWIVVRQCETEPVEVFPFSDKSAAEEFYERANGMWSDVYLCEVIRGPKA